MVFGLVLYEYNTNSKNAPEKGFHSAIGIGFVINGIIWLYKKCSK